MSNIELMQHVVDKYIAFMEERNANFFIDELVPESMIDRDRRVRFEGMLPWKAVPATVSDRNIADLETFLAYPLPDSYKQFLKHRCFIELVLGENQIYFFKNLSEDWLATMVEEISRYPAELLQRGYLPIGSFSDYGVVCFDANSNSNPDHEYAIVWLDHEDGYENVNGLANNFYELFVQLNRALDDWMRNVKNSE